MCRPNAILVCLSSVVVKVAATVACHESTSLQAARIIPASMFKLKVLALQSAHRLSMLCRAHLSTRHLQLDACDAFSVCIVASAQAVKSLALYCSRMQQNLHSCELLEAAAVVVAMYEQQNETVPPSAPQKSDRRGNASSSLSGPAHGPAQPCIQCCTQHCPKLVMADWGPANTAAVSAMHSTATILAMHNAGHDLVWARMSV